MSKGDWVNITIRRDLLDQLKQVFDFDERFDKVSPLANRAIAAFVEEKLGTVTLRQALESLPQWSEEDRKELFMMLAYSLFVQPEIVEESKPERSGQIALTCWKKLANGETIEPQEIIKLAAFLGVDPCQLKEKIESLAESSEPKIEPESGGSTERRRANGNPRGV